jgi:hypothetical protein
MKIFVQIASYRDPELVKTIEDILDKAKKPKNLVFAIARQYADEDGFDNLDKWRKDKRFKILDIPYNESKGACWARNLLQQLVGIYPILTIELKKKYGIPEPVKISELGNELIFSAEDFVYYKKGSIMDMVRFYKY